MFWEQTGLLNCVTPHLVQAPPVQMMVRSRPQSHLLRAKKTAEQTLENIYLKRFHSHCIIKDPLRKKTLHTFFLCLSSHHPVDFCVLPDSACMWAAFAFASSRAVIQRWRSTSQLAFRWYVCAPPLEMTKLQASSTVMVAVAKLIVPLHVWPISAWVLMTKRNLIWFFWGENVIRQETSESIL